MTAGATYMRAERSRACSLGTALVILLCLVWNHASRAQVLVPRECILPGLAVTAPTPWSSMPIDSDDPIVAGCQMVLENETSYLGIMRVVSFDLGLEPEGAERWENVAVTFESLVLERMNFKLGEPLWRKDPLPIDNEAFSNGKAIGLELSLEGVDRQNEAHFVLFEGDTHKYIVSLLTPAEASDSRTYSINTQAMVALLGSLRAR